MIDRETQQRIRDAANIVEVVGDYVKLTRRGANYMGLCPFHNERTPSFSVNPRRNFCHCFSCKKGGSPVNFLMEKEGIGYTEALLLLAKKYNIPVQERELSEEEKKRMSEREAMLVASEWAMNVFHDNLYNTEEGRDIGLAYLYSRGITDEAIKRYKLGYSIDRGDSLLTRAKKEGFDIEVLKSIGLTGTSQQGRDYDKFRGRVMFPIRNASGKPIAFGGRALKGEAAKYINSPETMLYKKSNELYGIFEAKADIIKEERVYLMEGYLDVIGSWQAGLRNSVASSGTALTESQIALIHRFTDNVTLIYDGDAAGIKASLRGIDMLLAQKLHVRVLLLPDGDDPDSFAKKHTPEEFREYIRTHQTDFIRFKIEALLKNADGNPQAISEAARSVVNSIACIPDEIERLAYIKECSKLMDIDDRVITKQVNQAILEKAGSRKAGEYRNGGDTTIQSQRSGPDLKEKDKELQQNNEEKQSSYINHEREIIRYCVRYAYLMLDNLPDEEESKSVIDYVAQELEADGLEFTHYPFRRIFEILIERRDSYKEYQGSFAEEVERIIEQEREKFREKLRSEGGSMAKIKSEEKKYAEHEKLRRAELLHQFAMNFSAGYLINHEETEVRETSNTLIIDRHTLSSIYTLPGSRPQSEETKLNELVPRALSELRSEILNRKVIELRKKIAESLERNDTDEQQSLMAQLSKVLYIRSRIAENLGERIISPR